MTLNGMEGLTIICSLAFAMAARADDLLLRSTHTTGRRELTTCDAYSINYPVTTETTVFWIGGGGADKEWINADNWQYNYLPGVYKYNRLIMAVNDHATVHCEATYMLAGIDLEMRSGATMDITANLNIGKLLTLKTNAVVTQSGQSTVSVGQRLYLASSYQVSDQAILFVGTDIYCPTNGRLGIHGSSATVSAAASSQMHGWLTFTLGANDAGTLIIMQNLLISSTYAKLIIDASAYQGSGSTAILLIEWASYSGSFATTDINGLPEGWTAQVKYETNGLFLELTSPGPVVTPSPTTAPPTASPTTANPTTTSPTSQPSDAPIPSPSHVPSVAPSIEPTARPSSSPSFKPTTRPSSSPSEEGATAQPTPAPTSTPSDNPSAQPTSSPSTGSTNGPTAKPSLRPSSSPSSSPAKSSIPSSSPTDSPTKGPTDAPLIPTIHIEIDSSYDTLTLDNCPTLQDETQLVVDGAAYTHTSGTETIVPLYLCTTGAHTGVNPIQIHLQNFPTGLWFEIKNLPGGANLHVKSLADYSEYWIKPRWDRAPSYNPYSGEYDAQGSTAHFPKHSFDTVMGMTYMKYRVNPMKRDWEDSDYEMIAKTRLSWFGLETPEFINNGVATPVKKHNPDHKFMFYFNSETLWGSTNDMGYNDAWCTDAVASGVRESCTFDHTIPAMREWWIEKAIHANSLPKIDGVWVDQARDENADFKPFHSQMVRDLAERPEMANSLKMGNILRQRDGDGNRFKMQYYDGSYFENQDVGQGAQNNLWLFTKGNPSLSELYNWREPRIVSMQLAREASWKRKLVMWNGGVRNCGCLTGKISVPADTSIQVPVDWHVCCKTWEECSSFWPTTTGEVGNMEMPEQHRTDFLASLATYLMLAEEFSYYYFGASPDAACERWRVDPTQFDEMNRPIGEPKGPPVKVGETFSRHFEHLSVMVDLWTKEATYIWAN